MEKICLISVLVILFSAQVFGKTDSTLVKPVKTELVSVDMSTGRSALSSGLSLDFNLQGQNTKTQITLRQDRIFLNHIYSVPMLKMCVGPSVGYFQNVPIVGAIGKVIPCKYFSTLHWVLYSFGTPNGKMNGQPSFLCFINSANINIWRLRGSYSVVKFMEQPAKHVVSVCYQQQVAKNFAVYADAGYDLTNKEQLLKFGVVWKQK